MYVIVYIIPSSSLLFSTGMSLKNLSGSTFGRYLSSFLRCEKRERRKSSFNPNSFAHRAICSRGGNPGLALDTSLRCFINMQISFINTVHRYFGDNAFVPRAVPPLISVLFERVRHRDKLLFC